MRGGRDAVSFLMPAAGVGGRLGLSAERVRQIEHKAMQKLKTQLGAAQ